MSRRWSALVLIGWAKAILISLSAHMINPVYFVKLFDTIAEFVVARV